jgi:hypothetical protein
MIGRLGKRIVAVNKIKPYPLRNDLDELVVEHEKVMLMRVHKRRSIVPSLVFVTLSQPRCALRDEHVVTRLAAGHVIRQVLATSPTNRIQSFKRHNSKVTGAGDLED